MCGVWNFVVGVDGDASYELKVLMGAQHMVDPGLIITADVCFCVQVRVAGAEGIGHLEARSNLDPQEKFCCGLSWGGAAVRVWVGGHVEVTDYVDCTPLCPSRIYLLDEFFEPFVVSS